MTRLSTAIERGWARVGNLRLFSRPRSFDPAFWIASVGSIVTYSQTNSVTMLAVQGPSWTSNVAAWEPAIFGLMWFLLAGLVARTLRGEYRSAPWDDDGRRAHPTDGPVHSPPRT